MNWLTLVASFLMPLKTQSVIEWTEILSVRKFPSFRTHGALSKKTLAWNMKATIRQSTSRSKSARRRFATIRDRTKSWRKSLKQSRMRDSKQPYFSTNKRSISTRICANISATLMITNASESSSISLEMRRRVQSQSLTVLKLCSMDVSMSSMTSVM